MQALHLAKKERIRRRDHLRRFREIEIRDVGERPDSNVAGNNRRSNSRQHGALEACGQQDDVFLPFHSRQPIGKVGEIGDLVRDDAADFDHRIVRILKAWIAEAIRPAYFRAALRRRQREAQRIAVAWQIEIPDRAPDGEVIVRERHDDTQASAAEGGHAKRVACAGGLDELHARFLRALQRVCRREQIEHQHVKPPLTDVVRLFGRERGVVDNVEVVDRLRLAVDEHLEIVSRERGHRRAIRADVYRHLHDLDCRSLTQLRVCGDGDQQQGRNAGETFHGTVTSARAKPIDVVPAMRAIAFAT